MVADTSFESFISSLGRLTTRRNTYLTIRYLPTLALILICDVIRSTKYRTYLGSLVFQKLNVARPALCNDWFTHIVEQVFWWSSALTQILQAQAERLIQWATDNLSRAQFYSKAGKV